jgi:predicted N-acetyltransferase YhbS
MQFIIRDAVPEDSDKLIELTSLAPMKGTIGLKIDRQPDFFRLLHLSESFIMLVAENNQEQMIGCFAATKNKMVIGNEIMEVYYLRDLKIHPDYKGSMLAYSLVKNMYTTLLQKGADILCCTMASGNDAVVPFFKGRAGIPAFAEVAKYNVYQILPSYNAKLSSIQAGKDITLLAEFFNKQFSQFTLKPCEISSDVLGDCVNFSTVDDSGIAAAIAAFNPSFCKQNIVTHYSFSIAVLLNVLRLLKYFIKLPSLPEKYVPLKIIYAKYLAFSGSKSCLKNVIQQLRHYAFNKDYHLIAIAVDEKDIGLNKLLKPLSRFVFKTSLLVTSLKKNDNLISIIKQGRCYEDYSLV